MCAKPATRAALVAALGLRFLKEAASLGRARSTRNPYSSVCKAAEGGEETKRFTMIEQPLHEGRKAAVLTGASGMRPRRRPVPARSRGGGNRWSSGT
jgi:hypothetical protein